MPTSQVAVTIKVPADLSQWVKEQSCNARNQVALFSEAVLLYRKLFLLLQSNPNWLKPLGTLDTLITPILDPYIYQELAVLGSDFPSRPNARVGQHVRRAIQAYRELFDYVGIYCLQEVDYRDPETGVLFLLEDLEVISIEKGDLYNG
ncbi:hypothetical protein [Okeania sp. SIO1H2]|uniref:hypothetical protein n=1 Tax=Okeania sp. SIO1H2 TaxID=2607775 RepID=UPI00141D4DBC|nr:hypothetical protein [Okeania sp. SIO1H2]NET97630.1 hypothetical protein [Okeania sp. SIO1H2]